MVAGRLFRLGLGTLGKVGDAGGSDSGGAVPGEKW